MKPQRTLNIKDKLAELGISVDEISLGDFDYIAELTAKRMREPQSELWKKAGAFFKPNLERGVLIYSLIKKFRLDSYLEIGFGRGYSALCAAKAFAELGNDGRVFVVEPTVDDNHMQLLGNVFPNEWTSRIQIARAKSEDALPKMQDRYDLVYVDGDHTKQAVRGDYEGIKDLWTCFLLMDDYHLEPGVDANIQVNEALEDVTLPDGVKSDLLIMDRRIFLDDRQWTDEQVKYGQLLLTRDGDLADRDKEIAFKETWDW
jgi:predicted O-methyltransferase YrrM